MPQRAAVTVARVLPLPWTPNARAGPRKALRRVRTDAGTRIALLATCRAESSARAFGGGMPASSANTRVVETPLMPPAWALPFVLLLPFTAWLDSARRALTAAGGADSAGVSDGVIVAGTLAVVVASVCAESAFYAALWAARGQRLALGPLALALWQLSALEPFCGALMERMPPGSAGALWLAPWLGARAMTAAGTAGSGWFVAFAGAGLLAVFRMMASAHVQARLAGRPWRDAAAQVMLVWLVSHIALAWLIDLLRGRGIGPS